MLLAVLLVLLLPPACSRAELLEEDNAPAAGASATVARVAASTFPDLDGYSFEPIPDDVWPQVWANLSSDFDQGWLTRRARGSTTGTGTD